MMRDDEDLAAKVRAAVEAQRAVVQAMHSASTPDWAHLDLSMGQLKALVALATAGVVDVRVVGEWQEKRITAGRRLGGRPGAPRYLGSHADTAGDSRRPTIVLPPGSEIDT